MRLRAKKSLGQHFLNSKRVLDDMVVAAGLKAGDKVLEIGPGTGILTEALLHAGAEVIAVEKDDRAIGLLTEKFIDEAAHGRLRLIYGDILDQVIFNGHDLRDGSFSITANIPYYITGAILERFLERGPRPDRMILLVQKEVADRIVAKDGKESLLSVSVKAFGTPRIVSKVPRGAFSPPPKVDSAVIAIENVSDKEFKRRDMSPERFFMVVKAGFSHKRKLAARNLEQAMDKDRISEAWKKLGLDKNARAEEIGIEQWFEIAECA